MTAPCASARAGECTGAAESVGDEPNLRPAHAVGLRLSLERPRAGDAMELLAACGVEETWRRSIAEVLAVIDLLDERIAPLHDELRPFAAADPRVLLLGTRNNQAVSAA